MAGSSLLALIDDIATILDDVAVMTKLATKKTAGVLGDDLALNAEQVSGVRAERELPVVWAVAKGSAINKAILVPAALAISLLIPWAIVPLLMAGGLFLCFEGFEKLVHRYLHAPAEDEAAHAERLRALADPATDMAAFERRKVKGAIRTDFILSAEIIVITLGTVAGAGLGMQVAVLCGIAVIMTIGVYGLVAGIVKIDDAGLSLARHPQAAMQALGRGLLALAPRLMKLLSVLGTAAMFTVGGGILTHGVPLLHHAVTGSAEVLATLPAAGQILAAVVPTLLNALAGIVAGGLVVAAVFGFKRLRAPAAA